MDQHLLYRDPKGEKEAEYLFEEIMGKNFPNLGKENQIHKAELQIGGTGENQPQFPHL